MKRIKETRAIDLWAGDQLSNGQVVKGAALVDEEGPLRVAVTFAAPGEDDRTEVVAYDHRVPVWADVVADAEYRLDDYTETGGSRWIHADGSPWQLKVGDLEGDGERQLTIVLGDSGYHQLALSEISYRSEAGIKEVAGQYDETDSADDIEQLLLAASRLLGGRLSTPVETIQDKAAAVLQEAQEIVRDGRANVGEAVDFACASVAAGDEGLRQGLHNVATGWLVTASFDLGREGNQTAGAVEVLIRAKTLLLAERATV